MENRSLIKAAGVSLFDLKLKKNNFCYAGKNTREDWLQGEVWEGNLISRDLSVWHLYLELTFFHNLNIPKDLTNNTFVESVFHQTTFLIFCLFAIILVKRNSSFHILFDYRFSPIPKYICTHILKGFFDVWHAHAVG